VSTLISAGGEFGKGKDTSTLLSGVSDGEVLNQVHGIQDIF
jgi:hypothetical protein